MGEGWAGRLSKEGNEKRKEVRMRRGSKLEGHTIRRRRP